MRFLFPLLLLLAVPVSQVAAQSVFINELHYDNTGTDTNEGVEIAAPAGTNLGDYKLVFYNGPVLVGSSPTLTLSGIVPNAGAGYGFVWFPKTGIENGTADGVALVLNTNNSVVQFLSWEGGITATAGVAAGLSSIDIGVSELSSTAEGLSLQLSGTGTTYGQFVWAGPVTATPGQVNRNQTVGGVTYQMNFTVTQDVLVETVGVTSTLATISVSPAPLAPLTVTISNSDPTELTVPASVVVPVSGLVTFVVQSVNDGVTDGNQVVNITASAAGSSYPSKTVTFTVMDSQAPQVTTFSGKLRLAAFNVLNGVGSPGTQAQLAVREILQRINPDVIAFEEVDDANTFDDIKSLVTSLGFATTRNHLVWDGDAYAGQTFVPGDFASNGQVVVIASKYPITEAVQIGRGSVGRKEMSRYPLFARIDVPGVDASQDPAVVAVHLKASSTDADKFRRMIEGYRIRQYLSSVGLEGASKNVFVLGDFNEQDEPGQPVSYTTGIDPATFVFADASKLPVSYVLGTDLTGANSFTMNYAVFPHSGFAPINLVATPMKQADSSSTATYNLFGNARLDYIFCPQWMVAQGLANGEIYNSRLDAAYDGRVKNGAPASTADLSTTASDHFCVFGDYPLASVAKLTLTLSQESVKEYAATVITANVHLSQPASTSTMVTLRAYRPSAVKWASSTVAFLAGQSDAAVSLTVSASSYADVHRDITLLAESSGWWPGEARLAVQNEEPAGLVIISQYIENGLSGTAPKAVELLNMSGTTLDFAKTPLAIRRFSNGLQTFENEATITSGLLGPGQVVVVGDSATGEYLLAQGLILPDPLVTPTTALTGQLFYDSIGNIRFYKDSFTYNGDDALELVLAYTRMDVLGTIGTDPGVAWSGSGVSTANQNISLLSYIGTGSSGFSDPSKRFTTVSITDELTGMGVPPVIADDYLSWAAAKGLTGVNVAPEVDVDGDGLRNLMEYAVGTNPVQASAVPLTLQRALNGRYMLSIDRRTRRPGLIYGWESSSQLQTWSPQNLAPQMQASLSTDYERLSYDVTNAGGRQFWRMKVTR